VAGNVEKGEAPTLLRVRLEIRLDEDLDGLVAGINFDTNRRFAKVSLVASSVRSSNDGVRHCPLALGIGVTSEKIGEAFGIPTHKVLLARLTLEETHVSV
jgi:hypothetical protein